MLIGTLNTQNKNQGHTSKVKVTRGQKVFPLYSYVIYQISSFPVISQQVLVIETSNKNRLNRLNKLHQNKIISAVLVNILRCQTIKLFTKYQIFVNISGTIGRRAMELASFESSS